jgi:hypothetical protein
MAGRRITDRASFAGNGGKYPFSEGNKMKSYESAEGAGAESNYPDTSDLIKKDQNMGISKAKAHKMKDGYRN